MTTKEVSNERQQLHKVKYMALPDAPNYSHGEWLNETVNDARLKELRENPNLYHIWSVQWCGYEE